jgi:hypothetical protein
LDDSKTALQFYQHLLHLLPFLTLLRDYSKLILNFLIKSAFRLLPMYQGEFDLLGFKINNWYIIDKYLTMGCSVLCSHFERFSTFLHWVTEMESGLHEINHYLDDFLL